MLFWSVLNLMVDDFFFYLNIYIIQNHEHMEQKKIKNKYHCKIN